MTALSNMAAASRPPGIGDARVPCPLCGGLIHPVAGRCKHCKEDLSSLRAGRPQAAAPLPALNKSAPRYGDVQAAVVPASPYGPNGPNGTNGHASAVPIMVPAAGEGVVRDGGQPILPPRPTSQWHMKAQKPGGLARHWPLLVIVLAAAAIVAAVIIMVLPEDEHKGGKRHLPATPAPDRMETDPLNKQSQLDPWDQGGPGGAPGTAPDPGQGQGHMPDPPRQHPQAPDPDDIWGGLSGPGPSGGMMGGQLAGSFMFTMMLQACHKLQSCPGTNQQMLTAACSQFNSMPHPPMPQNCPSAQKCLDAIDALDCDANIDNPLQAITLLQDCTKAATEC